MSNNLEYSKEECMSVQDAAVYLGCSDQAVRNNVGVIFHKVKFHGDKKHYIPRSQVEMYKTRSVEVVRASNPIEGSEVSETQPDYQEEVA